MHIDSTAPPDGLFARAEGRGPVVLCLHCSTGSHAQWRGLVTTLAERWHTIAPDLHGHGRGPAWPGDLPGTLHVDASVAEALVRAASGAQPSPRVHLVGHSYGGAVAMQLALRYPLWVRSLTLYEPVPFGVIEQMAPGDDALGEIRDIAGSVAACVAGGDLDAAARVFIGYWSGADAWHAMTPPQQATIRARMGTVTRHFEALFAATWSPRQLARLRIPILLMHGSRTRASARRVTELLADALPHAQRIELAGAGHLGPLTHAGLVAQHMAAHLGRLHAEQAGLRQSPG